VFATGQVAVAGDTRGRPVLGSVLTTRPAVLTGDVVNGALVRTLRRDHCLTQHQLAAKLGVGQPAISNIENGRTGRPEHLAELAAVFGLRDNDLLINPHPPGSPAARPAPAEPRLWTVPQTARFLGISRHLVHQLVTTGALKAQQAGRSVRISAAAARAYATDPRRPAANPLASSQQDPALVAVNPHRLRELRQARDWTRLELAKCAGLSVATVSALETGHTQRTRTLPALAAALGVSPSELAAPGPSGQQVQVAGIADMINSPQRIHEPGPHIDGKRLRELRRKQDMTQAELARRTGISRSFISTLERGHRKRASIAPTLAHALGVTPADLTPAASRQEEYPPAR
jgi:transcriptional regulator with XRE-family HTH domain